MPLFVKFTFLLLLAATAARADSPMSNIVGIKYAQIKQEHISRGLKNVSAVCINGHKYFGEFEPGVVGDRYYKFLVDNRSGVVRLMADHRDQMERQYEGGMSSGWLLFCMAIGPFLLIWLLCGAILLSIMRATDTYLMLDDYYKED